MSFYDEKKDCQDEDYDFVQSRSSKKREVKALEALAYRLMEEGRPLWKKLALSENLRKALEQLESISARVARKRHEKRIAALVRKEDQLLIDEIRSLLEDKESQAQKLKENLQYIESLRDRLSSGDRELALSLLADRPSLDKEHFLFLFEQAVKDKKGEGARGGRRRLFLYLREKLVEE